MTDLKRALLGDREAQEAVTARGELTVLDLCGGSGSWSRPFQQAGYDVRMITLPDYDVLTYEPPGNVWGILATPPCTEFSVLNCKAEPRQRKPEEGLKVVMACFRIIEKCKPVWWSLENPVGYVVHFGTHDKPHKGWFPVWIIRLGDWY